MLSLNLHWLLVVPIQHISPIPCNEHRFFIAFDALQILEIIQKTNGKPRFLHGFRIFSKIAAKSKKMAMQHPGTLKMEAWAVLNALPRHQNDSRVFQNEAQERQDGLNGCPDGPWQPNLLLEVLPNTNFGVSESLWNCFRLALIMSFWPC